MLQVQNYNNYCIDRRDLERITGSLSIDDPSTQPNIVYGAVKKIATNTCKTITTDKGNTPKL